MDQRSRPWRAFTMVYRDTTFVPGAEPVVETFRVTYAGRRQFSVTLLAHSARPETVGWSRTVSGGTSTVHDPRVPEALVTALRADEPALPADWLVPAPRPPLALRPGARTSPVSRGLARVEHVATLDGAEVAEALTYRTADGIPVSYVQHLDGRTRRVVEVLELDVA